MAGVDTRNLTRESLIMMADMKVDNVVANYRIKVRNLSPSGMMGAGNARVMRGSRVAVTLRGLDPVDGSIAWVQGDRFGIAFDKEVDSEAVKDAYFRNPERRSMESAMVQRPGGPTEPEKFRRL